MNTPKRSRLPIVVLSLALLTGAVPLADVPLIEAVQRGDVAAVRTLLRQGADPNLAQGDGETALHVAAETGQLEIARLLLDAKAAVDARTRLGGYTPLHLAAGRGHTAVVSALLSAGADPKVTSTTSGATPLHLAAKALNGEGAVRALLEAGAQVDAHESSAGGQTPLMFAASFGRTAAVRELIRRGADPSLQTEIIDVLERLYIDQEAQTQLRQALQGYRVASGDTDRESTLAEQQAAIAEQRVFLADKEWQAGLLYGFNPDWLARVAPWYTTQNNNSNSTTKIVVRPQETLVGKTGGMTALLHAAREGRIEAVEALLDGGADIDQRSGDGTTPLVLALLNGRFDLAMVLIKRGADPNLVSDTDGITPLFALLQTQWTLRFNDHPQPRAQDQQQTQHMEVLNALLEAGADPNVRLKTHLWHFEWEGKMGLDITGATPFWRATFAQDLDAMKALVAHGADANVPTIWPEPGLRPGRQSDGRNEEDSGLPVTPQGTPNMHPIHAAAGGGYLGLGAFQQNIVPNNFLNTVKYLVEEQGADVNLPDSWGYTPLHYASVRGDNPLVEYLVSKGANVKAMSRLGQSTVDLARGGHGGFFDRAPHPETVELLLGMGAEFKCLHTHFRNNGDWCPTSGVPPFEGAAESVGNVLPTF